MKLLELKGILNTLSDDELQQDAKGWDDMRTCEVVGIEKTDEVRYWDGYQYLPESDCEGYPQYLDKTKTLPKGTIRLNLY